MILFVYRVHFPTEWDRFFFIAIGIIIAYFITRAWVNRDEQDKFPDGGFVFTDEDILYFLENPKDRTYTNIRCPKCYTPSLHMKRKLAYVGSRAVGKIARDYHLLEPHFADGKKVIAICMKCGHNRHAIESLDPNDPDILPGDWDDDSDDQD